MDKKKIYFRAATGKLDFLKRARNLFPEQSQHERARATFFKLFY